MRLIDGDKLIEDYAHYRIDHSYDAYDLEDMVNEQPTIDVLDKIRAEIEQYQADCNLTNSDEIDCKFCDSITFDTIYRIIDRYRNEVNDGHMD